MIRVLHVLGGLERGGAETMVMNLYRAIDKSQIQFDFIIHTEEHQAYYDEIIKLGGKIYSFPKFNGKNYFYVKKNWKMFFLQHPEYKILHSHVRSYASIYLPVAKKYGVKTIIHSHSTSNGKGVKSFVKKIMQYPLRIQADFFMGCSKEAGEWLFGKKIIDSDKYVMLQNAIDTEKYIYNEDIRKEYKDKLGLKDNKVFIHVGRFHPAKNHPFLLDLFKKINNKDNKTKLLLVGDGELRVEIEKKVKELELQNSVMLLGSRSDVANILQAADCFLFPSNWEGLPVTVVEAQASGLPCLVSNHVTKDVCVSNLVNYLPINEGVDPWVNCVSCLDYSRKNVLNEIIKSGFDITSTSRWLSEFYINIAK